VNTDKLDIEAVRKNLLPTLKTVVYATFKQALDELVIMRRWVGDLQSGMYVNCVYCGHRYGPADEIPTSMADVLRNTLSNARSILCPQPISVLQS